MRRIFPTLFEFSPISPFGCCVVSGSPSLFRKGGRSFTEYGFWGTPDRRSADGNSLSAGRTPALPPPTSQIGQELRRVSIAGRPESQTVQRQLEELQITVTVGTTRLGYLTLLQSKPPTRAQQPAPLIHYPFRCLQRKRK
jgi:hypothetical protein